MISFLNTRQKEISREKLGDYIVGSTGIGDFQTKFMCSAGGEGAN